MTYPDHNPFPPQAVTTIEGIDWDAFVRAPTFERPAITQVLRVMRRYQEDTSPERVGRAVAVRGDHGTGKTHCVAFALATMRTAKPGPDGPPVILYARADNADELTLYQRLTARLSFTELRDLAAHSFAGYATEAFAGERSSDPAQLQNVSTALHQDPDLVRQAIDAGQISLSAMLDLQEKDIERVQGRLGSFDRALRSMFNPQLSTLAHMWMTGQELANPDLRALGVPGNLVDATDVQTAVHVLAAVARRAHRSFYVALDQAEAFLVDDSDRLSKKAAGFLRTLLEVVTKEGGCFVVSMNNETWTAIPRDLRQRFGPASFTVLPLTSDEATGVVSAYLAPWRSTDRDTFPLTADGIQQLLVLSGGNVRRFLQACFLAFQNAAAGCRVIDGRLVQEETRRDFAATSPSELDVRNQILHSLRRSGAPFVTETTIAGTPVDFAIMDGDHPVVLIEVTRPLFAVDEAEQAVKSLDLVRAAKAHGASAILVVVGYSSPDVVGRLEKAAERVFVADGPDYVTRLVDLVEKETRDRRRPTDGPSAEEFDRLRDELLRLQKSRTADAGAVRGALAEITENHAAEALPRQLAEFRRGWLAERQRVQDDLRRIRAEQQKQDVQEVVALHDDYQQELRDHRDRRARQRNFVSKFGSGVVISVALVTINATDSTRSSLYTVILAMVAGLTLALVNWTQVKRPASIVVAASPSTVAELQRAARQEISRSSENLPDSDPSPLNPDPYGRYAALLLRSSLREIADDERWEKALDAEPARLLRVQIARLLCERGNDHIDRIAATGDSALVSVAVEAASRSKVGQDDHHLVDILAERPVPLVSLAVFHGIRVQPASLLGAFLGELRDGVVIDTTAGPASTLARAYESDDDEVLLKACRMIPERQLRRAADELAPDERRGLCSFYWLTTISELDEIYVFFRKALFLSTTGLS